jgi:hypothetical protein
MALAVQLAATPAHAQTVVAGGVYAPIGGSWGPVTKSGTSVGGRVGSSKGFRWEVQPGTNISMCVQFMGFKQIPVYGPIPTVTYRYERAWYNGGCGTSGAVSVPWGPNLAQPEARARSLTIVTGGFARWWQ